MVIKSLLRVSCCLVFGAMSASCDSVEIGADAATDVQLDASRDGADERAISGVACASNAECASDFCIDGVCCNAACDGVCVSCLAASTGEPDGQCAPVSAGTDPDNECDAGTTACTTELCDGASACSTAADGVSCRPAQGECDSAEVCSAGTCPIDALKSTGEECRPARGECDAAEVCDGTNVACPSDAIRGAGSVCRAALGDCDLEELCDGVSDECPVDVLMPSGAECRAVAGSCDAKEVCDGTSTACAPDAFVSGPVAACGDYLCSGAQASCATSCTSSADCVTASDVVCNNNMCERAKLAFVSSTTYRYASDIGGLLGGDSICNTLASAAGLPGTYKAWLSDTTGAVATRFTHSTSAPYARVDKQVVADNWADLTDGTLAAPISVDESGAGVGSFLIGVWTGTNPNGSLTSTGRHCNNWLSSGAGRGILGRAIDTNSGWTHFNNTGAACDTGSARRRIYCVGQ